MATSIGFDIYAKDQASKVFKDVGSATDTFREKFKLLSGGLGDTGARMSKIMTIAGAAGPALLAAGAALSAAAAGGVAVSAALAPAAAGGVAVYAGALLAVKQGAFVLKFALNGLSQAVGGNAAAMKALTPEGRAFAKTLIALKPQVEGIRAQAQKGLFPGLEKATSRLAVTYMPMLRDAAYNTGNALGALAIRGSQLATSGPWRKDFGTVTTANQMNMFKMGEAGLSLADAARSLYVTALPLIGLFMNWAVGAAKTIDSMVQAGRASGELQKFWARAAITGKVLGGILGNLGAALGNVFQIGASGVGPQMLRVIEKMTKHFRDWTGSASGAKVIAQWFETGRQNLAAMGRLVGAVFGGMKSIGSGSLLAPLIDQVTKKVIPPLMQFLQNASASGALNALVDAVASVVQVFATLSASDSSLKSFATTLKILADSFGWVMNNVPGASKALGVFFVVMGANQAIQMVGLGGAIKSVVTGIMALKDAALLTRVQLALLSAQEKAVAVGTLVMAGAQKVAAAAQIIWTNAVWAFNIAVEANPIGLIVVGIVALIAVIVLAYKKVGWFHAGVDAALHGVMAAFRGALGVAKAMFHGISVGVSATVGFIKSHWKLIAVILGGPVVAAAVLIVKNWGRIKSAFSSAISSVVGFVRSHWGVIVSVVGGPLGAAVVQVIQHWGQIKSATSSALNGVVGFFRSLPGRITGALGNLGGLLKGAGKAVVQGLIDGIGSMVHSLTDKLHSITKLIPIHKGPLEKDRQLLTPAGVAIMEGLIRGIESQRVPLTRVLDAVTGAVKAAGDKLKAAVSARNSFAAGFQSFTTSAFGADFGTDADGNPIAPTAASVIAFQQKQAAHAHMVKADVGRLTKMGLSPALLKQLQSAGEAGIPVLRALAGGTKAQVQQYNALNKRTSRDLGSAGMNAANSMYGKQIREDRQELTERVRLRNAVEELVHELKNPKDATFRLHGHDLVALMHRVERTTGAKP